jgi:hypothetical protein
VSTLINKLIKHINIDDTEAHKLLTLLRDKVDPEVTLDELQLYLDKFDP